MKKLPLVLTFLFFAETAFADSASFDRRLNELEFSFKSLENSQDNYKIEKELLEKVYSANYDKMNFVLAAVFGVFTVIGFFQVRSVNELKNKYEAELKSLIVSKAAFEKEIEDLKLKNTKQDEQIAQLSNSSLKHRRTLESLSQYTGKNKQEIWELLTQIEKKEIGISDDPLVKELERMGMIHFVGVNNFGGGGERSGYRFSPNGIIFYYFMLEHS